MEPVREKDWNTRGGESAHGAKLKRDSDGLG